MFLPISLRPPRENMRNLGCFFFSVFAFFTYGFFVVLAVGFCFFGEDFLVLDLLTDLALALGASAKAFTFFFALGLCHFLVAEEVFFFSIVLDIIFLS
jgi:hypothetical protein